MYNTISSLYANPKSRVLLVNHRTDYFDCLIGVKQGDSLSPTLFAVFINDLVREIKETGIGVVLETKNENIDETTIISILLYADDIVLFAQNEEELQSLLLVVEIWCQTKKLRICRILVTYVYFQKFMYTCALKY